jgi:flagellum-specific peptidoglycan hydrolase FlgJ
VVNGRSIYINAAFKAYHNAAESFIDRGKMLRRLSRYAPCFRYRNDPARFCQELQKAGYATDPLRVGAHQHHQAVRPRALRPLTDSERTMP